jgi:hypothetical protein
LSDLSLIGLFTILNSLKYNKENVTGEYTIQSFGDLSPSQKKGFQCNMTNPKSKASFIRQEFSQLKKGNNISTKDLEQKSFFLAWIQMNFKQFVGIFRINLIQFLSSRIKIILESVEVMFTLNIENILNHIFLKQMKLKLVLIFETNRFNKMIKVINLLIFFIIYFIQ